MTLTDYLRNTGTTMDEGEDWRTETLLVYHKTFVGVDRYMRQQIFDFIAISNTGGHPDIFLTMMCSLKWEKVTKALLRGKRAPDRPDICARDF